MGCLRNFVFSGVRQSQQHGLKDLSCLPSHHIPFPGSHQAPAPAQPPHLALQASPDLQYNPTRLSWNVGVGSTSRLGKTNSHPLAKGGHTLGATYCRDSRTPARQDHALKKQGRGLLGFQFHATHSWDLWMSDMGMLGSPGTATHAAPLLRQAAQQLPFIYCPFLSEETGSPLTIPYRPKITPPRAKLFQMRNDRHTSDILQANCQA